jgi:hypothetical protein
VTTATGPPTTEDRDHALWILDGLRHGGHSAAESLAYLSFRSDEQARVQVERDRRVSTTAGLDLGPRRGGFLRRLLGW